MSEAEVMAHKRLVLVLDEAGCGASLLAGILARTGFHALKPTAGAENGDPPGLGEPRWVAALHARLTHENVGGEELQSWLAVQLVGRDNLVVDDLCSMWFLPLWRHCAQELGAQMGVATVLRHPTEVVVSARKSEGKRQGDASRAAAWLNVMLHAEDATRDFERAFVLHTELLDDWSRELSRCAALLDVPWRVEVDDERHLDRAAFVEPNKRASAPGWDAVDVPPDLRAMCDRVWDALSALAHPGGDTEDARAKIDTARAAYFDFRAGAPAVARSSLCAGEPRDQSSGTVEAVRMNAPHARPGTLRRMLLARSPSNVRQRIGDSLRMSEGLPLTVRAVLLLPPSFRERLPLPVLHVARRLVRATRR
jgi:hypothetical protein